MSLQFRLLKGSCIVYEAVGADINVQKRNYAKFKPRKRWRLLFSDKNGSFGQGQQTIDWSVSPKL